MFLFIMSLGFTLNSNQDQNEETLPYGFFFQQFSPSSAGFLCQKLSSLIFCPSYCYNNLKLKVAYEQLRNYLYSIFLDHPKSSYDCNFFFVRFKGVVIFCFPFPYGRMCVKVKEQIIFCCFLSDCAIAFLLRKFFVFTLICSVTQFRINISQYCLLTWWVF